MRAFWQEDAVILLKLREDLYTVAQMMPKGTARLRFYKIFHTDPNWKDINLNEAESLFTLPIGNVVIQKLGVKRLKPDEVMPSSKPYERFIIFPKENYGGDFTWRGGKLVDTGDRGQDSAWRAPVVIEDLTVEEHKEIILQHQLGNFWGADDLAERLIHFYEKEFDFDALKNRIFPGLYPPTMQTQSAYF